MEKAIIDCGSNSIRLFLPNENGKPKKYIRTTRLGRDIPISGELSTIAISETLEAIREFVEISDDREILIFATSAVRDAKNRDVFINSVKENFDLTIDLLSGEQEAEIGFLGVVGQNDSEIECIIIDIGGGSTEFIKGRRTTEYSISLDIGAVRLSTMFYMEDGVYFENQSDISKITEYIESQLEKIDISKFSGLNIDRDKAKLSIFGIGGTISSLGMISLGMEKFDEEKIDGYELEFDEIVRINGLLQNTNISERHKIKGLEEKRKEIILSGGLILEKSMEKLGIKSIIVSLKDNLEGYLRHFEKLVNKANR